MDTIVCPANCGKMFQTAQALNSHITQARNCSWYRTFEKSAALDHLNSAVVQEDLGDELMQRESEGDLSLDSEQAAELLQEFEEEHDPFHFVPLEGDSAIGEAGPGPSTQAHRDRMAERQLGGKVRELDDGDLSLFEVEHATGGVVLRMDPSLHECWQLAHSLPVDVPMDGSSTDIPQNLYAPFASEMDWRVAEWVVKDNIGHNSFNRLLQIPGVCTYIALHFFFSLNL